MKLAAMSMFQMSGQRKTVAEYDTVLAWVIAALLSFGLVMVYSASIATAEVGKYTGYQSGYYLLRHAAYVCIGLLAGAVVFQIPVQTWQKKAPYLFLLGVALLILVLIPEV